MTSLKLAGVAALAALAAGLGMLTLAPSAVASHEQVSILEEDTQLFADPAQTIAELRHLGVEMIRVPVRWSWIAPDPKSFYKPNFDATDPNAYPAANWAPIDAAVLDANAAGIKVLLNPTAFAPLWAQGPDATSKRYDGKYTPNYAWEPNAAEFGQFVQAVGARYSGTFVPAGQTTPLPKVSDWEIYDEPNFGEDLAPQAIDGSSVMDSPKMYRSLVDKAWSALRSTGHSGDTIILGSLLADGYQSPPTKKWPQGLPGTYGDMMPLVFVRELYCLNSHDRRYLGQAAQERGCPTTNAGYASFKSEHPALFQATGFSDHPYDLPAELPPTKAASSSPNWAEFSQIPHMASVLDQIQRLYGSNKRFQIWNTEFGYITCPPNCTWHWVSPATAAYYINWAEYLSWRNPRLMDTMQYLLYDPDPTHQDEPGGFSSGLVFYDGVPKPEYYAYRMPLYLPFTQTRKGRALEVWGDVRPAPFAVLDGDGPQYASIQFERSGSSTWTTLKTLQVTDPHGYFDTWITFPSSGSVRISWTYPPSDAELKSMMIANSNGTIYSRTVSVTLTPVGAKRDRRG
jgi:hypothetical protein